MAAPSRLGNLTFSYHKETNGSLKKLRKPRTGDFPNNRNTNTLGSSSYIFDKSKQRPDDTTHQDQDSVKRDQLLNAELLEQDDFQNKEHGTLDRFRNGDTQYLGGKEISLNGRDESDNKRLDDRDKIEKSIEKTAIDPLEKLIEESVETKFYPEKNNENYFQNGSNEIANPEHDFEGERIVEPIPRDGTKPENKLSDDRFSTENNKQTSVHRSRAASIQTSFSSDKTYTPKMKYNDSNVSRENSTVNEERQTKSNHSNSFRRNVSFSVPEKELNENKDGGGVAKVTRSNSKRLINDDNNLQSLFSLARSNENLDNLNADDPYFKVDYKADDTKRQRVKEQFSSKNNFDNSRIQSDYSEQIPNNDFYEGELKLNSSTNKRMDSKDASNLDFDQVDSKPIISQYRSRSSSLHQNESSSLNRPIERPTSRVELQPKDQSKKHISEIGNMVNRTKSLTSKDISSIMSFDDNREASAHKSQISQDKPKRILPKPGWKFNSESFRTTKSMEDNHQARIKKSQSFADKHTDLDGTSIQNIGDALISSDFNMNYVSSNDQQQEDSILKPHDFKKRNIKISRSPGFKSSSFSAPRAAASGREKETQPVNNTALKNMGGHLISSDSDTVTMSMQPNDSLETDQRAVAPAQAFVRNRTRSFDELLSDPPETKHLESNESTRGSDAKTTSKYNSLGINYAGFKGNDVETKGNESSPVNSISFSSSALLCHEERRKGEGKRSKNIKLSENFASLSLKEVEKRDAKTRRSALLSRQQQSIEDAETRRTVSLSPQEQRTGNTKKKNTNGIIHNHIDEVNQRLKQNIRWNTNTTEQNTGYTHHKQNLVNSKKRVVNRRKNQNKRPTMEYGEFDHALMKDNDSEGLSSIDDGYETARTYGSDLTNSTVSDLYQSPSNGLNIERSTSSTNQRPPSSISTNHKVQSLSNLHEILNLESEDERKKKDEEERRVHAKTEAETDLEQGRKGIHHKLDNMLKARVKTMNSSDRSFAKRQMKFPDPLLVNEPPLIIDKEPSLQLEESIKNLSKQQQSSSYTSEQYGGHQERSQPVNQQPYAMGFPQNINHPERQLFNQQHSIMGYFSDQQPTNVTFSSNTYLNHTMANGSQPHNASTLSRNHYSTTPGNQQPFTPGNYQHPNTLFNQNHQPSQPIYDDQSELYARPVKTNQGNDYTMSQNQPRQIDASYNSQPPSNYGSPNAPVMETKLFHLRDKESSELNKKESMLNELKLAMFKRSRPASPEVDQPPFQSTHKDYGNNQLHYQDNGNQYGSSSLVQEQYQHASSSSSFEIYGSHEGQVDLYDSFPLPTTSHHTKSEKQHNGFQMYQIESDEKLTDENPIDKNQVMMMLKSHIKEKTGLSSVSRNKDINFSRPKISSQTFSLTSKDVDSETVKCDSRNTESNFHDNISTPDILVTEFNSPEIHRSRAVSLNHGVPNELETVNVRKRASTFSEVKDEREPEIKASTTVMDDVDALPNRNTPLSRVDSFQSPYSIKYTQDTAALSDYRIESLESHNDGTPIARNASFSPIIPESRSVSRIQSFSSTSVELPESRSISRVESFKSHAGDASVARNTSLSSMRVEVPESRSVSRIQSFSSEYQPRARSHTVMDSALRYEKTKKVPANTANNFEEPLDLSLDLDLVDRDASTESSRHIHEPFIATDSRGLNLSQTEYYLPEENEEKVIKPSEYKTHRFNDRNRSPKTEIETESRPTTGRIQLVTETTEQKMPIEKISSSRISSANKSDQKLSLNELKKKRQQERLLNSKRLSNSEPLLDRIDSEAEKTRPIQHTLRLSNNVRVTETVGRKKKVEKYSSEIYTNTNVGKINIPDSFQNKDSAEWLIAEQEKQSDEKFNERKHKREKVTSNSSTPRASTPKKSRRRFSLTNIVSGSSTPRSARTDITDFSNISTSSTPTHRSVPATRPSSPSLGKRIKNIFSPRSKRKNTKGDSLDDSQEEMVDDDIIRRLNMNVTSTNNGTLTASTLNDSLSKVTSGYSSIRSESGLSMTIAEDEDFGIDDSFLSHQEWLNSHGGKVTVMKRPSIKQAIVPVNSSRNAQNTGSWKVRKNIGKVTVPEVFSSSAQHKMSSRQNGNSDLQVYNSKFRNLRSSPVMTRKSKSKKSVMQPHDDVVFTSFDVAE